MSNSKIQRKITHNFFSSKFSTNKNRLIFSDSYRKLKKIYFFQNFQYLRLLVLVIFFSQKSFCPLLCSEFKYQKFIFGSNAGELNGPKINRILLRPTHVTAEGLLRDTNMLLRHFFVKCL
jgi:hypothetical protein